MDLMVLIQLLLTKSHQMEEKRTSQVKNVLALLTRLIEIMFIQQSILDILNQLRSFKSHEIRILTMLIN